LHISTQAGQGVGQKGTVSHYLDIFHRPRDLPIPNRDAKGIHYAMEFLQTQQQKQKGDDVPYEELSAKGNPRLSTV